MLPLQKKVNLDDDFSKKKESSALLSQSNGSRQKALADDDEELFLSLLPALLSFSSFFLVLSLSLSASARSLFFLKAEEAVRLVFENCAKTLNKKLNFCTLNCAR
jgi:hypothetical protein